MRLFLLFFLAEMPVLGQQLAFSPLQTIEKTVSHDYYDTDYIFITNIGEQDCVLEFELVEATIPPQCSVTGCTNTLCYPLLPETGMLGDLQAGEDAYLSINLAVNDQTGEVVIRYAIFDPANKANSDTIAFIYKIEADTAGVQPEWAKINYELSVITVFVQQPSDETTLRLYDTAGHLVHEQLLENISSLNIESFSAGIYFLFIESKSGRRLTRKIVRL